MFKADTLFNLVVRKNYNLTHKNRTMKVTVVGAGAVGASCAEYIAIKDFAAEVAEQLQQ